MSIFEKKKKMVASILIVAMMFGTVSQGVLADGNSSVSDEKYPYTIFAASEEDGALSAETSNMCINGNVAVNGTVSVTGNININGTLTENAGLKMIFIFDKIETKYFLEEKMLQYEDDYTADENNINISVPTDVLGEVSLTGNINITTALKALDDIELYGEVKNTNNSVIFSKYGNIYIDGNNANLNGLIYAPFGDVYIESQNLNLNNVIVIAQSVTIVSPNINANYSTSMAEFVGNESELLYIPYDEWEYMGDENENGIPDFFEDMDNWCIMLDTDGDGLPDSIEEYLGTDSTLLDTDGDGLPDYYELFSTYTSPLLYDTYENGIGDGDEDFDDDGLTCATEYILGTMPYDEDTDGDGLMDGEEVDTYMTDPLNADTDEDGLEDGDEVLFDCDPLDVDTDKNGIYDGEEKRLQTFLYDNKDGVVKNVSVTFEAKGNIQKTTTIENIMGKDVLCSEVAGLVGDPFSIETESEFDTAIITFEVDKEQLGETQISDLLFLWYDTDNYEFVEMDTVYDEETSTVSIETTHFSRYMIVDRNVWFSVWSQTFDYNNGDDTLNYTVLAIDCSGSMSSYDPITEQYVNSETLAKYRYTCNRIVAGENFLETMKTNDKAAVVLFNSTATVAAGMMRNTDDTLRLALQKITNSGGTSFNKAISTSISTFSETDLVASDVNKRIILMTDGQSTVSDSYLQDAVDKGIQIFTVGLGKGTDSSVLKHIAEYTGGEYYETYTAEEILNLYQQIGINWNFDTTDTDGDGLYDAVEIAGILLQDGTTINGCDPTNPDTDGDGLLDGEEINPTIKMKTIVVDEETGKITTEYYFEMSSNPTKKDSDGDSYSDYDETVEYSSDPLVCEVEIYNLASDYIEIDYEGTVEWVNETNNDNELVSYGGNQKWFVGKEERLIRIYNYGCGLISASDVLLYLTMKNENYSTPFHEAFPQNETGNINYDVYYDYVLNMNKLYFPIIPQIGVNGLSIASGLNDYFSEHDINLKAKWFVNYDNIIDKIQDMLLRDIPVTLSIGPIKNNCGVKFYDCIPQEGDKYNFQVKSHEDLVSGHYVTITGMIINEVKKESYFIISSCGSIYYINTEDYFETVEKYSDDLLSNIIYIE